MKKNKSGKLAMIFKITNFTIYFLLFSLLINSNFTTNDVPEYMPPVITEMVAEQTADASSKGEQHKENLYVKNKHLATEWLYRKTDVIPKSVAIEYVDFIANNVKPQLQPLVTALLTVESGGNSFALSPKGACGLTQIIPRYWSKELIGEGLIEEDRDLFDYKANILCSQYIIEKLLDDANGNVRVALSYYGGSRGTYSDKVLGRVNDLNRSLNGGEINAQSEKVRSKKHLTKKKR